MSLVTTTAARHRDRRGYHAECDAGASRLREDPAVRYPRPRPSRSPAPTLQAEPARLPRSVGFTKPVTSGVTTRRVSGLRTGHAIRLVYRNRVITENRLLRFGLYAELQLLPCAEGKTIMGFIAWFTLPILLSTFSIRRDDNGLRTRAAPLLCGPGGNCPDVLFTRVCTVSKERSEVQGIKEDVYAPSSVLTGSSRQLVWTITCNSYRSSAGQRSSLSHPESETFFVHSWTGIPHSV